MIISITQRILNLSDTKIEVFALVRESPMRKGSMLREQICSYYVEDRWYEAK